MGKKLLYTVGMSALAIVVREHCRFKRSKMPSGKCMMFYVNLFTPPMVTWVPFILLHQCLTYTVCHVHLPVLISFLSLERQSSTSVSSAYVFTLYVLYNLIRRFNRQKVYAFQEKLSTRRAIRFYVLRTTVRSTGTLESRQIVDKYVPRREAVHVLRKTD